MDPVAPVRRRARLGALSLLLLLTVLAAPLFAAPRADAAQTVVTLGFDDGFASQYAAHPKLLQYGMRATYYVNSGLLGKAGYMTMADVQRLQAAGMEIGGHTINHRVLAPNPSDLIAQVCQDRVTLTDAGLRVTSFAYPEGAYDPTAEDVVATCGYNSARTVGGIRSGSVCGACPVGERLAPLDPYVIHTPDSIKSTTTLAMLQTYVTQAEAATDPTFKWVPLVFHEVCASSCSGLYVSRTTFDQFIDWLATRPTGPDGTVVRTVDDVIGGAAMPAVSTPPETVRVAPDEPLVNASLEAAANPSVPDCFEVLTLGGSTAISERRSDGHTGMAQRITGSNLATGRDVKILRARTAQCAVATTAGEVFSISLWYRSTITPQIMVFSQQGAGASYLYHSQSPPLAATDPGGGWTRATFVTPPMPSGATSMTFGLAMKTNGEMSLDDVAIGRGTDRRIPFVALTEPNAGTVAPGAITVSAAAADLSGVTLVEFLVNGSVVGSSTAAPYSTQWDTGAAERDVTLRARATDRFGNVSQSAPVTVHIGSTPPPPPPPPPPPADTTAPHTSLTLDARDPWSTTAVVRFTADEPNVTFRCSVDGGSFSVCSSPFTAVTKAQGTHVIAVRATDSAGNVETPAPSVSYQVTKGRK